MYIIKEENEKFNVCDGDFRLESCNTKEEANKVVKQWQMRDKLELEIQEFIDTMVTKYSKHLASEEIRKMIKEG